MQTWIATCLGMLLLLCCVSASSAQAEFGVSEFDLTFRNQDGSLATQAGSHPFQLTTTFRLNTTVDPKFGEVPDGQLKTLTVALPAGFAGSPTGTLTCQSADFLIQHEDGSNDCPDSTAVGATTAEVLGKGNEVAAPVYNLVPPPGKVAKLGFFVVQVPVTIEIGVSEDHPYRVTSGLVHVSNAVEVFGGSLTVWGNPADSAHDPIRGNCVAEVPSGGEFVSEGTCPTSASQVPFLLMPRSCTGPLETAYEVTSWQSPLAPPLQGAHLTHEDSEPPLPQGLTGCSKLAFSPAIGAKPTTLAAQSPTGLDFSLDVADEGIATPDGLAASDIREVEVTLPKGMSINPSQAEGLEVCSESQLDRESAASAPGEGCPQAAKIGTIEVETPLLPEEIFKGSLYVAEPYRNPFDSLLAFYIVIKDAELGISVVQAAKVTPDPATGQLVTTTTDMPQIPFSHFRLRFREGARSPLVSPPGCGRYDGHDPAHDPVRALLTPWAGGAPVQSTASFEILTGPNGSACPSGPAPFDPGFEAGTLNNAAGAYSPFLMRLTRADGMQDLSRFSATLPPGVAGRIAAIPWCPEAGIAQARSRTGEHGGTRELADPSCPAASRLGSTQAGAGVGSQLTYVPGSLYLAGPYNGAPLSVVSITPAVAGPFDAGAVVVRVGLRLNPVSGVVEADGSASDPIPHILQGIPLNVRDLRVNVDRPDFTLNATSCEESNTFATLWGAGTALEPLAETPLARSARYQAAGCAGLAFKPKLAIKLRGGTKRGAHPALRAVVTPRPGDANFSRAVVTLPRSAFLEQGHIRTICTRVQFAAGPGNGALCPPGAQYGFARAWSPLLDAPAQGPVFLRSSDNNLPDLVVALKGPASAPVDVELSARIDSVKGGIRSIFTGIPDLPVSRFILDMQGGKKGLIVNSRNLCHKPGRNRAKANLRGQNGRFSRTRPRVIATTCQKRRKAKRAQVSRALIADQAGSRR